MNHGYALGAREDNDTFVGIIVALVVGVGVAMPVIQDTMGETLNTTDIGGAIGTIVNLLPLMIGLVLFVAVAALITLGRR
ncbi:hypothetical protein LCGC14_2208840 [marine sediment metagenome]|uniref:Uncharacterized protein n=1 Tax=marine sediment metagenome TaxID=412755 RepID=A0A0F9DEK6_9ZZZZ